MSEIAFIAAAGSFPGAREAGLAVRRADGPGHLRDTLRDLMAGGARLIAVEEDPGGAAALEVERLLEEAPPGVSVIVVPAPGAESVRGLRLLRERFAAALGADVWESTAEKAAGGD